jgi:hypothetical protein
VGAQNIFPSKDQCATALLSGRYEVYEPKFFGLKETNPVDGKTKVLAPIESKACVKMLTAGGEQWVIQVEGTVFRWKANPDGSLGTPYARDDCGNPISEIYYPVASQMVVEKSATQPVVIQVTQTQSQVVESPIKGLDYYEKQYSGPTPTPVVERPRRRCGGWCKAGIGLGIGVGIYLLTRGHSGGGQGPGGVTGPAF